MIASAGDTLNLARQAALAELRRSPVATRWTRQAAAVVMVWLGLTGVLALAALAAGLCRPADVSARLPVLAALASVAALGGVGALAPRARLWAALTVAAVLPAMALLVASRGAGAPATSPAWVCSVTHLAIGSLPLAVGLWAVRQSAWSWPRALATGLGAGTTGAFLGELACHQGARHALVHHLGAWWLLAIACLVVSRTLRPRTFAP